MAVIVAREAVEAQRWAQALREQGIDAQAFEGMHVRPTLAPAEAQALAKELSSVFAVMAVSANAVRAFWQPVLKVFSSSVQVFSSFDAIFSIAPGLQHWATGPGTAAALRELGVPQNAITLPDANGEQDSEALWEALGPTLHVMPPKAQVWVLRGADADGGTGRPWFADRLRESGCRVQEHLVYRRELPQFSAEQIAWVNQSLERADTWVFANGHVLSHIVASAKPSAQALKSAQVRCTHPRIAELATRLGFQRVYAKSLGPSVQDWVASLESST